MKAITYNAVQHGPDVQGWCRDRAMSVFPEAWLPPTGAIVEGVLAAWLYKTDSGLCYMENVISSPSSTHEERAEALAIVAAWLELEAVRCGFRYLLGFSSIPTVIQVAEAFGMKPSKTPYFTLVKELSNE